MSTAVMEPSAVETEVLSKTGYKTFTIGGFKFARDEYFAHIFYPGNRHIMQIEAFLRALMRDVAWGFFYGTVNFDAVFGTVNHYGSVDMFVGSYNEAYRNAHTDYQENFQSKELRKVFEAILADWTNDGFDPFAAPEESGVAYGPKHGANLRAVERQRVVAKRMVGMPGDTPMRSDENGFPINRQFADVAQDVPEIHANPGYEGEVHAFNLFAYLSRSDVTWNPSVCSVVKDSLLCPTTEEQTLPIVHGNDRVEWFIQVSDEIFWEIGDKNGGAPRAHVLMKAGDVAAMPADIKHQGFSPKRSMLIVWENNNDQLPAMHASGQIPPYPVEF